MTANGTDGTPKKRADFLAILTDSGNVSAAADACALSRRTLYNWRATDPAFAADWDEALEIGLAALEDEAIRRAREGVEEPVYHGGLRCGTVRRYSDLLLIFLLKSRRPGRYGLRDIISAPTEALTLEVSLPSADPFAFPQRAKP